MKTSTVLSAALLAIALAGGMTVARADSTDATCEVRKDGDKQKGKSGPCTFSQRQGYIDIDLKNGDTISLSPAGGANHYRDQKGNKVTRTTAGTTGMSLKWENGKHVNVTWTGNRYGGSGYDSQGTGGQRNSEYQRGYGDGQRGDLDRDKHNQDYKDGYAAGEAARGGHRGGSSSNYSGGREYGINRLDDGQFEVVSSNPFCSVRFNARGEPQQYSDSCTPEQQQKSYEVAQRER